ncbi:MAG: hypothetical protein ACI86M_003190 [Saprospiraceae bacterium]|jgi:hypothetical protein
MAQPCMVFESFVSYRMIVSFYIALLRKTFFIPNKFDSPLGVKIGFRNFSLG